MLESWTPPSTPAHNLRNLHLECLAPVTPGSFLAMVTPIVVINNDLVDKIMDHIPHWTWSVVKEQLIQLLVDNMTSDVLIRLTGSPDGFDEAEDMLRNYYIMPNYERELLIDTIKILGSEQVINTLDKLQLDKFKEATDTTPCSIEPQ